MSARGNDTRIQGIGCARSSPRRGNRARRQCTIISAAALVTQASGFLAWQHLATAMSKPVERVMPFSVDASPTVICRRNLSFVSSTRFHVIVSGSTSSRTNLQV